MKILLVDDNNERVGRILRYFAADGVAQRDEVGVCSNASDARDKLEGEQYDLLILDILLPYRAGDNPSAESSLSLLIKIVDTNELYKPGQIVGLTAYSEEAALTSKTFQDHTWTVLPSDETSDEWLARLGRCVAYVRHESLQRAPSGFDIDLLVVTALRDPEMTAVHRIPWNWETETPLDPSTFYRRGFFESGDRRLTVVSAVAPRMGLVPMALMASKLIERFHPRCAVMPGICAGVAGRANMGDVIFAESSWDYQSGKHVMTEERVAGFMIEPYPVMADASLSAAIEQLSLDHRLWSEIRQQWPGPPPNTPRLLRGPVASGSAVLADSNVTARIVGQQRKVRGIEMEIYALYLAAEQASKPRPMAIGLKAVCDFADESKSDDFQHYAAFVSARAMQCFFERYGATLLAA